MKYIFLLAITLFLYACSEATDLKPMSVLNLYQGQGVAVSLSPAEVPVEQILNWRIQLSEGWQIKQAVVVGLSMSMGTIPLQFKSHAAEDGVFAAEMVLGACSQPKMQWQLQLTLTHVTEGEQQLLLPFYSSWGQ